MKTVCHGYVVASMLMMGLAAQPVKSQQVAAGDALTKGRSADAILDRKVTIDIKSVPLEKALQALADRVNTTVIYDVKVIARYQRPVTLRTKNIPLREAFDRLFAGTSLQIFAQPHAGLVVVDGMNGGTVDSTGTIIGTVVDSANGKPVPGATVSIDEIKRPASLTSQEGFVLRALPVGAWTVVVKAFGYRPARQTVVVRDSAQTRVKIVLTPVPSMLSGVVTTATGQQKKLEVGNSIVSLNVDSIMQTAPIRSVIDILDGRVPGMTVQRTSGTPGDPARIRLRGTGSILQNNDPIIIVDGIRMYGEQSDERNANIMRRSADTTRYATPSPLDQMDPNMIETIEVLKGPSASSLYGSDAANGVIVITTKKGGSGGTHWSLAGDQGLTYIPGQWQVGLWPFGRTPISDVSGNCAPPYDINGGCNVIDSLVPFQALNEPRYTVAGRGSSSAISASFSGGRGGTQYAYTVSARNELGLLKLPAFQADSYRELAGRNPPGWMKRPEQLTSWSVSTTSQSQLSEAATVSITALLHNSVQRRSGLSESFNSAVASLSRLWIDKTQVYDGSLFGRPSEQATSNQTSVTLGSQAQWRPVRWLPLTGTVGVDRLTRADQILLRAEDDPSFLLFGIEPSGHMNATDGEALNQSVSLNTNIPVFSRLTVALGLNYQSQRTNDATGYIEGFARGVDNPSSGAIQGRLNYQRTAFDRQSFGWFVEPQLSFQSRFFIMPGIRLDNNGLSGKNAGLNGLPKMNLSWIASEEPFFPFKTVVDLFRVRTAFGVAGVQPSAEDRYRLLSQVSDNLNSNNAEYYGDMLKLTGLGNTRLRPERSGELEGGFDAEAFRGRIKLDVTMYRKMRYDAIVDLPLASSVGTGGIKINLGVIRNQGSEFGLDMEILESRNVVWNVGAALSTNSNKVIRLNGTDKLVSLLQGGGLSIFQQIYRVGYPTNGAWTTPVQSYYDLDGDGLLTRSEVVVGDSAVFMGSKDPTRTAALRSGLTVLGGRLALYTDFNYTGGLTQTDGISAPCASGFSNSCATSYALARFNTHAPLDEQAAAVALQSYGSAYGFMRRVSSWRFQTASLNVNFGQSVARLFRARTLGVALQGSNLGLWTNYRGKDPNVNGYVWGNNTVDLGQLPQPRTWALRVSLGN